MIFFENLIPVCSAESIQYSNTGGMIAFEVAGREEGRRLVNNLEL
jgi:hypothetical protein